MQDDPQSGAGSTLLAEIAEGPNIEGAIPITLRINGKDRHLRVDPRTTLLDCIRETVDLILPDNVAAENGRNVLCNYSPSHFLSL